MKLTLFFTLLILSQFSFSQDGRKQMAHSKIYMQGTYFNQVNKVIGIQLRTDLKDTSIQRKKFLKFKTEDFVNYPDIQKTTIYFESFEDGTYQLLDDKFQYVHRINYKETGQQTAILFGNETAVSLELIARNKRTPGDTEVISDQTPRKYYQSDHEEVYAVIIPDIKKLAVSSNGKFYTKQLYGDNYNDITEGVENDFQVNNHFHIQIGDEVQLFYRRKWNNDSTGMIEYNDKQYKNFKYIGDTLIDKNKTLKIEIEGYSYLSGFVEEPEMILVQVTDTGYFIDRQFIEFRTYGTEMNLSDQQEDNKLFFQGVSTDTINGFSYQKITQVNQSPYRTFLLPFFPLYFIEFGNVQAIITYRKIKGIEQGAKQERTYITDTDNIRSIQNIGDNKVELNLYFTEEYAVKIEIRDSKTDKVIGKMNTKSKASLNSFIVRTDTLKKDTYYKVEVSFENKNASGSFLNGFKH